MFMQSQDELRSFALKKKLTLRALARGGFFLLKIIIYNLIVDKVHKLL